MTETPPKFDAFPKRTTRDWPAFAAAGIGLAGLVLSLFAQTSLLYGRPVVIVALAAGVSALVLWRQGRAKALWAAVIAVVLAVGGVAGNVYWGLATRPVIIRYEVRGNVPYVDLRYTEAYHENGDIARANIGDMGIPVWAYTVQSYHSHDPGELVATIPSGLDATKSISCEVFIDGARVRYALAKGSRGVADCSGF